MSLCNRFKSISTPSFDVNESLATQSISWRYFSSFHRLILQMPFEGMGYHRDCLLHIMTFTALFLLSDFVLYILSSFNVKSKNPIVYFHLYYVGA